MDEKDALIHLVGAVSMGTSEYIQHQEKQGQKQVSNGRMFPIDIIGATREQLEAEGFVFGDKIDDLFQYVSLPAGWEIRPTDHSMWSDILDNNGNKRGSFFYKAAFYDRCAFVQMSKP